MPGFLQNSRQVAGFLNILPELRQISKLCQSLFPLPQIDLLSAPVCASSERDGASLNSAAAASGCRATCFELPRCPTLPAVSLNLQAAPIHALSGFRVHMFSWECTQLVSGDHRFMIEGASEPLCDLSCSLRPHSEVRGSTSLDARVSTEFSASCRVFKYSARVETNLEASAN